MNNIESQRIRIMKQDDLEEVFAWRNHPDVRRFMYTQHEITAEEHARWFNQSSLDVKRHLLIFEQAGRASGFINLYELTEGIIDWGFYVAPNSPKGTGRQLGTHALAYAFGKLNMHKVCGQVLAFNESSIQFHLHLGFRKEGLLREQHFDGVRYHNIVCFGLLASEWKAI